MPGRRTSIAWAARPPARPRHRSRFRYNPVTDTISAVAAPWPGDAADNILPGGFAVFNNKLYILGGFETSGRRHRQTRSGSLLRARGPGYKRADHACSARSYMHPPRPSTASSTTGGGAISRLGLLMDTTNSFSYNPVANTIGTIAAIPRAQVKRERLTSTDKCG